MPSPKFSDELQPHKHVVAEQSLKCASSQVLRAVTCTFVCQYMCTTAVSCSPLLSLHFFCSGTCKECASLCTEMVCAIQNVLGCPGLDAEMSMALSRAGGYGASSCYMWCRGFSCPPPAITLHVDRLLLCYYLHPLLKLQHWHC